MKTGLLESTRKYSPREGKDPLENFITEAFSWILNNYCDFSDFFLDQLEKRGLQSDGIKGKNCEWKTQVKIHDAKPDMVCVSTTNENKNMIIFEHKTWSGLSENQLQKYRDAFSQITDRDVKVVLITATRNQHEQKPDLALCWSDVYKLISDWIKENTDASFIFEDFIKLLRSEGMGPAAPVAHASIKYYLEAVELEKNIRDLIKRAGNELIKSFPELNLNYAAHWGRVGFEQSQDLWRPGIFVGILLDGTDHGTKPIDSAKGPDFCLILDFNEDLHNKYPSDPHYKEMVSNLAREVGKLNNGWQFYNHLDEVEKPNSWHPIHIRKPMLDVFAGTLNAEEQDKVFSNEAKALIKTVTDENYFQRLRADYN